MVYGGILQSLCDLGEIHIALPDHLLAFLQFYPPDILAGGDLQMLVEQAGQITGADICVLCNQRNGELVAYILANVLLGSTDDLVFVIDALGTADRLLRTV